MEITFECVDAADGEYDMMLRPDCLHTDRKGDYCLTVESVLFRGSDTQVCFRAEDGTLWKKNDTQAVNWVPGDILQAQLQIQTPVLFA